MKINKRLCDYMATVLLTVVLIVGFATANVVSNTTGGVHILTLNALTNTVDFGTGVFNLNNSDSTIRNAIFLANAGLPSTTDTGMPVARYSLIDTYLAIPATLDTRGGAPKLLSGSAPTSLGGTAGLFVQISDTARITVSSNFSSSTASLGTWNSTLTNANGTCSTIFASGNQLTTKAISFESSAVVVGAISLKDGDSAFFDTAPLNVRITAITHGTTNAGDSMRLIVINSAGKIAGDTTMIRDAAGADTVWQSVNRINFETGANYIALIFWDANMARYGFKFGSVTVGPNSRPQPISVGGVLRPITVTESGVISFDTALTTATVPGSGITALTCSPSVTSITPTVVSIQPQFHSNDNNPAPGNDAFATWDSNSNSLSRRLANTVFSVSLFDASGAQVTKLTNGSIRLTVKYNFGAFTGEMGRVRLFHHNATINAWEALASTVDSAAGTVVADVTEFSHLGLGVLHGPVSSGGSNECVINSAVSGTDLAGIMPSLRSARDTILSTTIGRMLTSGYYSGFFITMLFAGFSLLTVARRRA